jgi:centromere protein J
MIPPDNDHVPSKQVIEEHLRKEDGKVQRVYADGRREVVFPNGVRREVWPDGFTLVYFTNQDVKQTITSQTGLGPRIIYYFFE